MSAYGPSTRSFFRVIFVVAVGAIQLFPNSALAQTYQQTPFAAHASPLRALDGNFPSVRRPTPLSHMEELALRPMDHFKECKTCPEMVVVPAGRFAMGSPESEVGSTADERPQHSVTFAKPFAVGRFAVTFDEWEACIAAGSCRYRPSDQGWGRASRPVIDIIWDDAKDYVWWLSKTTGKPYRLLSEAEREYITRAGTTTAFWWGTSYALAQANYNRNSSHPNAARIIDAHPTVVSKTVPVNSYAANPWGLYQVHGNVEEWVEDCWHDTYAGAPSDGTAWIDENCSGHVLRGGSFGVSPHSLRSAARSWSQAPNRLVYMSVRVARTLK